MFLLYLLSSQIHCELAYFDEIDEVLISIGSLHLSETTTTTLEHIDTDPRTRSKAEEPCTLLDVHARIWCLTIIGFEWSDEGEEDGYVMIACTIVYS